MVLGIDSVLRPSDSRGSKSQDGPSQGALPRVRMITCDKSDFLVDPGLHLCLLIFSALQHGRLEENSDVSRLILSQTSSPALRASAGSGLVVPTGSGRVEKMILYLTISTISSSSTFS